MERIISQEERIKRAEEIYQRRNKEGIRLSGNTVNISTKTNISLFKKMFVKILICIVIYVIFYVIKNSNYIFSQDILNKTDEVLSYDMNLQWYYGKTIEYFKNLNINVFNTQNNIDDNSPKDTIDNNTMQNEKLNNVLKEDEKIEDLNNINKNIINDNQNGETQNSNIDINNQVQTSEINKEVVEKNIELESEVGGIGGGNETENIISNEQKSQMQIDADYIKNNYKIIVPLKGTVTSRFGKRTKTDIISGNHAGIDIGESEGTKIVAAMDGKATVVSSVGDYGNHLKVVNGNVTTLYAHCRTIYVKEGDEIKQGMEIAEVGSTGKATGPHLHFEIRVDDRVVDPEYVLKF